VVSAGSYVLSLVLLGLLVLSLGVSAVLLRRRLLPAWEGAPARLVEAITGVALLIWLSELLGVVGLFYAEVLVGASGALTVGIALATGRGKEQGWPGQVLGFSPRALSLSPSGPGEKQDAAPGQATPAPSLAPSLVAIAVVAVVFAHWGLTAADALGRGIFNFDSLWYHMPFATEMAKSHSVTGIHYTETVFTNWFYPQNSELLHSVGILLTERDTLSLFINFGWLAVAFLAAWCIGRPYGLGPWCVVAAAIVLSSHTLVVREPGAAKNDVMAAALLLAAIAILVNTWVQARAEGQKTAAGEEGGRSAVEAKGLPPGWAVAAAGLATGLAVGTKSTALAMAAALTVAAIALAPVGRRWAAAGWWGLPALAGGGYWYLRNLIVVGNPLPQLESLGPISLPHPERLQSGRPDFSIAHYATDTGVWSEYFGPGLHDAFGALWPLVIAAAVGGALVALVQRHDRVVRWMGGVALFGMVAYLFTPLSAAGADGAPAGFEINIRYAVPALLAGLAILPLSLPLSRKHSPGADMPGVNPPYVCSTTGTSSRAGRRWALGLLGLLLVTLVATDRLDAVLRDPDRLFGLLVALLAVGLPAALLLARRRASARRIGAAGFAALALLVAAVGYPVQRDYLEDRFRNDDPERAIPGMGLDSAYRWAGGVQDARIGLAGTTAGFLQYGFYGPDLSNRVRYLGAKGPHGAFNAIPSCGEFRAAVNDAGLDYLVTAPFLNFIQPQEPIRSPEAGWLSGEPAVERIDRSGGTAIWRIRGRLDPGGCGRANAPLRQIPQQPSS
jgi:hypothetical protein